MFGFFKTFKEARAAQKALTAAFKAGGYGPFMEMNSTVHEALVKEAIATGVEATMHHFDMMYSVAGASTLIGHYKARGKAFQEELRDRPLNVRATRRIRPPPASESSMLQDLPWLPEAFVALFVSYLKQHHEQHGWGSLATHLTDTDLLTFVTGYPGLWALYKRGASSWPSERHEYQTYVASIVLTMECLGSNFFASNRTRLLDAYMPRRAQIEDRMRQSWRLRAASIRGPNPATGLPARPQPSTRRAPISRKPGGRRFRSHSFQASDEITTHHDPTSYVAAGRRVSNRPAARHLADVAIR